MRTGFWRYRSAGRGLVGLWVLIGAAACESTLEPRPGEPVPVAAVELDLHELDLEVGGSRALTAQPRGPDGTALPGRPVTWTSSNQSVATVNSQGVVSAVATGTARITASTEGKWDEAVLTVREVPIPVGSVELDPAGQVGLMVGEQLALQAIVRSTEGLELNDRLVTWSSHDEAVGVSAAGVITAVRPGQAVVSASAEAKSATVLVVVSAIEANDFDLLYDSRTSFDNRPEIYRMSLGGGEPPARLFESAGAWDVTASPDGSRIAFTCANGHGTAICAASPDGTEFVVLTPGEDLQDQPAWSPDGTRIAFRRWSPGGPPGPFNPSHIWVMNADGTGQTRITDSASGHWEESPTWSPKQSGGEYRIAFSSQRLSDGYLYGEIHTVRDDGTDQQPMTGTGYLDTEPTWSPDGGAIAFIRTGGTAFGDLWLVQSGNGVERPLFESAASDQRSPQWSPDGRYIAFTSMHEIAADNRWAYHIYTLRPDGAELTRRTTEGIDKENPVWLKRP